MRQTLLFDFYGDLLTEHQREVYEDVVCNDTSFSELAAREGVSRQSIHELVHKCDRLMENYEKKLHMMEQFLWLKKMIQQIRDDASSEEDLPEQMSRIRSLCDQILEDL